MDEVLHWFSFYEISLWGTPTTPQQNRGVSLAFRNDMRVFQSPHKNWEIWNVPSILEKSLIRHSTSYMYKLRLDRFSNFTKWHDIVPATLRYKGFSVPPIRIEQYGVFRPFLERSLVRHSTSYMYKLRLDRSSNFTKWRDRVRAHLTSIVMRL